MRKKGSISGPLRRVQHTHTHARTHARTHTHEPNKLTINDIEKINLRLIIHSLYKNPVNFN